MRFCSKNHYKYGENFIDTNWPYKFISYRTIWNLTSITKIYFNSRMLQRKEVSHVVKFNKISHPFGFGFPHVIMTNAFKLYGCLHAEWTIVWISYIHHHFSMIHYFLSFSLTTTNVVNKTEKHQMHYTSMIN